MPRVAWPQGNPLGPEFQVNTYTTATQDFGSVAVDSSGNFVVVWTSAGQDGPSFGIFGQRFASSGAALGPEFRVNTYTTNHQLHPSVTADPSGNVIVVWESVGQDGSASGVFGQRFASSGAPVGPEFRVNTYTTNYQTSPSVSADPFGTFVVVWNGNGPAATGLDVFGQRFATLSGAPLGSEFRVNTYTPNSQDTASIAADASGRFVVVWESTDQDGAYEGIFGQRLDNSGAPLGSEFRVNTFTTQGQFDAVVAADAAGDFIVVWTSYGQDGSHRGLFGQRYAGTGAPLGQEFRVNTFTTNYQGGASIAADASGNFVVVWKSFLQDGSGSGIFGQRYAESGNALGPEFRVNTYTSSEQYAPAVASDSAGRFVVTWSSYSQDGFNSGVFGQRYAPILPVELMRFDVE